MEREEVIRIARDRLGEVLSRGATGEYGMLARLLEPGEEIVAMVLGKRAGGSMLDSGQLIVATDRRLLEVSKSMLSRREKVDEIDRRRIRGARMESIVRFVLDVDGAELAFTHGQPQAQIAAMIAWARGYESRFAELDELARRKLGRMLGAGLELDMRVLDTELEPDEAVLDLAYAATKPQTVIAVLPSRVVLLPQQGLRQTSRATAIAYDRLRGAQSDGDALILETWHERHELRQLLPDGAAEVIAGRISARLDDTPPAP